MNAKSFALQQLYGRTIGRWLERNLEVGPQNAPVARFQSLRGTTRNSCTSWGGRDCAGVRIVHDDEDIWAIRANDPDKTIAQRTWTTEIVVAAFGQAKAYFSLRLFMSSPEWDPDIAPAVPGLVQQIATKCSLYQGPDPVTHGTVDSG